MSLHKYFKTCLDLPNVEGAFCLTNEGELIESFMPAPYTDEMFEELGARIISLTGAVDMSYAQTHEILLHFESHSLYLRKNESCIIGIFTLGSPLLSGLKVTVNLLLKQADGAIKEAAANPTAPTSVSAPAPQPAVQAVAVEEEDDDIIIAPKVDKAPSEKEEKRGFFGRKKEKKSSNDIWG